MSLFPFFVFIPIADLFLLIKSGSIIGFLPTLAIIICTASVGVYFLKQQSIKTFNNFNQKIANLTSPIKEVFDSGSLLIAGALLITPGFITDIIGFLLLFPVSRDFIQQKLLKKLLNNSSFTFYSSNYGQRETTNDNNVIDAEFTEIKNDDNNK